MNNLPRKKPKIVVEEWRPTRWEIHADGFDNWFYDKRKGKYYPKDSNIDVNDHKEYIRGDVLSIYAQIYDVIGGECYCGGYILECTETCCPSDSDNYCPKSEVQQIKSILTKYDHMKKKGG